MVTPKRTFFALLLLLDGGKKFCMNTKRMTMNKFARSSSGGKMVMNVKSGTECGCDCVKGTRGGIEGFSRKLRDEN